MFDTDPWGIDRRYLDALGEWHQTTAETRRGLLEAMGVDNDEEPEEASVLLVHPRSRACLIKPGRLLLESGEDLGRVIDLPRDLPFGYHTLIDEETGSKAHIICSPGECYLPPDLKTWGWSLQLYALRSAKSWGIGDLSDLREFARWSTEELGAGLLLINPLGAPTPVVPINPSPYYPSSRRFRNPLFIAVEEVHGAAGHPQVMELGAIARQLNGRRLIDRNAIWTLKREALHALFSVRGENAAFDRYVTSEGDDLRHFATFCSMAEGDETAITFHMWLQWLLDEQLQAASRAIPLMQDLPSGVDPNGADAWAWKDLLANGASVGAPPDAFNTQGQNWGLPPFIPHKLRAVGYKPFIQTIRAALHHAGGLRIDHVMGLFRLFWIPTGQPASAGAYVRYRADEMLAIIAIESHRAKAFVVGEDLGTLEAGVSDTLQSHKILTYRVLWFEKDPPATYPDLALAAVTTHDLPTIAGLCTGADLDAQYRLGLKPNAEGTAESCDRLHAMTGTTSHSSVDEVIGKTYSLLGSAPCSILMASVEDLAAVVERPNMPATVDQWPNWSIGLPKTWEELKEAPMARSIAHSLSRTDNRTDNDARE